MKILLTAINAKYIHSNPAVYSLKASAEMQPLPEGTVIEIAEYTINHNTEAVRADIYLRHPDVIGFSCYLWNIIYVERLVRDLKKLLPTTEIWLGGPEVSYHPEQTLAKLPEVTGIMVGPGERTFSDLVQFWGHRDGKAAGFSFNSEDKSVSLTDAASVREAREEEDREPNVVFDRNAQNTDGRQLNAVSQFNAGNPENQQSVAVSAIYREYPETEISEHVPNIPVSEICRRYRGERILEHVSAGQTSPEIPPVPGIAFRTGEDIRSTGAARVLPLADIPFWYSDLSGFENRIIYYESSRGCPFSCSYCLSSIDKRMEFRSPEQVCRELQFFLDRNVPQVKFIDRTFNCRESHALNIWKYIAEHDNGVTNFHLEISADILTEAEMKVLEGMRPGLVQLEIGVQSTNMDTVRAIHRVMDLEKLKANVARVHSWHNIHQHLDLIAGLPKEDYDSFGRSFDDVYAMEPDQLQLGFLKVLKGAAMEDMTEAYDLLYSDEPPYEVLSTRWLGYDRVLDLKGIEEMVEMYYNSGQFSETLKYITGRAGRPFIFYEGFAAYWKRMGYDSVQSNRAKKYQILLDYVRESNPEAESICRELLIRDCYLRENMKNRPDFGHEQTEKDRELWKDFLREESREHRYLPEYAGKSYRDLMNLLHGEIYRVSVEDPVLEVYLYQRKDPLSGNAETLRIPLKEIIA